MVFPADAIYVSVGVNMGDGLEDAAQAQPGDIYELADDAEAMRLIVSHAEGQQTVADGSSLGRAGDPVRFMARLTLMGDDGNRVELMIISVGSDGIFALPMSPMGRRVEYTLLVVETAPPEAPLNDLLCVSFARGTMITLPNGRQRAIEALKAGDTVLTRDHGAQPIRWIGHATLRAVGAFAPVVITAGAMGNAGDLIVSQHHRMFLYQRNRTQKVKTAELFVQAKHLVNGDTIFLREGGFVDYLSLVFDSHEIIYAEGIPAESLLVTEATVSRLPPEISADVRARFPGLSQNQHFGTEAGREMLSGLATPKARRQPPIA